MRRFMLVALMTGLGAGLAGCDHGPIGDPVADEAQQTIQEKVDQAFPRDHAHVDKVTITTAQRPNYVGTAAITANGSTFSLPVRITSDGKTTQADFDRARLADGVAATWRKRLKVLDQHYSDVILKPELYGLLPASLQDDPYQFKDWIRTLPAPVTSVDGYYLGRGCAARECADKLALWSVNQTNGSAVVIVKTSSSTNDPTSFRIYGAQLATLPAPLAKLAAADGMTAANVTEDRVGYKMPSSGQP